MTSSSSTAVEPISRYVEANGARFHYLDWGGPGPRCLMVHGSGLCGGVWTPIAAALQGRFRCLALDLRGHGRSNGAEADITWDLMARDVAGVVEALDLHDAWLVGHSRGASSALLSNAHAPGRWAAGVLVEPSILMRWRTDDEPAFSNARLVEASGRKQTTWESRAAMRESLAQRRSYAAWDPAVLDAFVRWGAEERPDGSVELSCRPETQVKYLQAAVDVTLWDAVAAMQFPVLLGVSEQISLFNEQASSVQRFKAEVPCTVVHLPGDHFTPLQHPGRLSEAILEFAAANRVR